MGLVFWKGVGTRCRYLKGGHPSTRCLEVKAGNKQGMLGTLAVSSRWECWQRMESRVGKQASLLVREVS